METHNISTPFNRNRTHHRTSLKQHQKWIPNGPNMVSKWSPKWSQNDPKSPPDREAWIDPEFLIFGRPRTPKQRLKITPKSIKTDLEPLFWSRKKQWFLRHCVLRFFYILEAPETWKSSQNDKLCTKNVGQNLLIKSHMFSKNWSEKSLPMHLKTQNNT